LIRISAFILLLLSACENPLDYLVEEKELIEDCSVLLHLYMNAEYQDSTGYYIIDYPINSESSYTAVEYLTTPTTRVFWNSEDTYTFIYWGREMIYPIITNSTYSSNIGEGRQLIYLYKDHIGDTLSVDGCIGECCERLYFIVREG